MSEPGQCKLCLQVKPLCNSHIIPELAYKTIYDGKHQFLELDGGAGTYSRPQKGFREPLLCDECEKIFQRYENCFVRFWYQRDPLPDPVNVDILKRSGFDFEPFYRFHLSIFWRAAVAKESRFSAVILGPFEEPLRQYLHGEVTTLQHEPTVCGIILRRPRTHELCNWLMIGPVWQRIDGIKIYTFVFGGCSWRYYVSKQRGPYLSLRLRRPGTIIMPVTDYTKEGSITRAWEEWRRMPNWKDPFG